MPTPAQLQAAVPHIVHDVLTVRQAKAFRLNKFGWIAWYPMARNVAKFLEVFPTSKGDIRASQFFDHRSVELKQWEAAKAARRRSAPPALKQLSADASQAAAHLSWKRVTSPTVQVPSTRVTTALLKLWDDFRRTVPERYRQLFRAAWEGTDKESEAERLALAKELIDLLTFQQIRKFVDTLPQGPSP